MRYAVIDTATNKVMNVVDLLEDSEWVPPEGTFIKPVDTAAEFGDLWDGSQIVRQEKEIIVIDMGTGLPVKDRVTPLPE